MSGPAYRMLELMYEWMDEAEKCSSNLRGLAQELESLREKCNAVETVSSTTAVAGTVLSILAAPFTGGASLLVGAVAGGLGAGVSVVTKLIEAFESSDKLERVKAIDRKCNNIASEIQSLYYTLRAKCPSTSRDEMDKYVVKEFLKAMLRRLRLTVGSDMNDPNRFVEDIMDKLCNTFTRGPDSLLGLEVIAVLSLFSLKLGGSMLPAIAAAGGVQIGKAVIGTGASAAFLGVVGLGINLYESISNWKELIENKHETDASKSVRETAKKIDKAKTNLSKKLSEIMKMLKETWTRAAAPGAPGPPGDEDKKRNCFSTNYLFVILCLILFLLTVLHSFVLSRGEGKVKLEMALLNAHSINKLIKPESTELIDLIQSQSLNVLLITETWLKQDTNENAVKSILPPGFSYISEPRSDGRRGGGVAIVYSDELDCEEVRFDTLHIYTFEFVVAKCTGLKEPVFFVNIYRPTKESKSKFLEELPTLLKLVYSHTKNAIVVGDFNIWVDHKDDSITRRFESMLNELGLVQHVSEITREPDRPDREGHTLDLILTHRDVKVSTLSVQENNISDHKTVLATVEYGSEASESPDEAYEVKRQKREE